MHSTQQFLKPLLLIYGLLWSLSSFADPATWELTFKDTLYTVIEFKGTVTYDSTTNTIDSFSINGGNALDPNTLSNGYGPGTNQNYSEVLGKPGLESNSWFFGPEYLDLHTSSLNIDNITQNSETSWTGEWHEAVYDDDSEQLGTLHKFIQSEGTVTATLVTNTAECEPAEYTQNTGKISISTLTIENKQYDVTLKKQSGYDFKITQISRNRENDCVQAEYISNKGEIQIPMVLIGDKEYKVTLKKQSGYDFTITHISRIR